MAGLVRPDISSVSDYQGLKDIFEFTNADGALRGVNCGHAAAATLLAMCGKVSLAQDLPHAIVATLEKEHPPDNLAGIFGSSRRRITRIFRRHGVRVHEIAGEAALRESIAGNRPVIVVLGVRAGMLFNRIELPGGHWTVAYGFDGDQVYLTNYGCMPWDQFRRAWANFVPRLIDMSGKGLVASS